MKAARKPGASRQAGLDTLALPEDCMTLEEYHRRRAKSDQVHVVTSHAHRSNHSPDAIDEATAERHRKFESERG